MLADGSAVTFCDGGNGVSVGVITEGGNFVRLGPGVEHGHAHAVVVGDNYINGVAERGRPGADSVAGSGGIPSGTGGVLHFLGGQLTDDIRLAVDLDGTILNDGSRTIGIGADGLTVDCAISLNAGAQSGADTAGTGDGVIVADIADGQDVTDNAVTIAVDGVNVLLDVILDHLALQFGTLVGIETNIIGVVVEAKSRHIQFAGGAVGRLTVEPYQGLVLVGNRARIRSRGFGCGLGSAGRGTIGCSGTGRATAGGQAQCHCSCHAQCKCFSHSFSPFA